MPRAALLREPPALPLPAEPLAEALSAGDTQLHAGDHDQGVAMAFGCTVHVHVADQKATTRWIDEHTSEEVPAISALAAGSF
jgi:hypothetical protein